MGWRENLFVWLNQRLARALIPDEYRAAMAAAQEQGDDEQDDEAEQDPPEEHVSGPHKFGQFTIREHWLLKSDGTSEYMGTPPPGGID